jgi:DNA-binding NarL/FixJ family response regulator
MLSPIEVLLVEDNPGDAYLTGRMLEDNLSLVRIQHCETLTEAIAALHESQYHCILLDLQLPDAAGTESIPRLWNAAPNTPIIIMTRQRDRSLALQAIKAGAHDYLFKDETSANALGRTIRYAIERVHFEQELRKVEERHQQVEQIFYETLVTLTSTLDLEEVLNRLLNNIDRIVGHDAANIILLEGKMAKVVRSRNASADVRATGEIFAIHDAPEIAAILHNAQVGSPLVEQMPCPMNGSVSSAATGYLGVPIRLKDQVVGLLNIFRFTPTPFRKEDVRRLSMFAEQAAIALQNARLHAAAQQAAIAKNK